MAENVNLSKLSNPLFATMTAPELQTTEAAQSDTQMTQGGYIDHGNGTVTDPRTGLMWKRVGEEGKFTWDQAIEFNGEGKVVNFGGFSDWRLPDIEELKSLLLPSSPWICEHTFPNAKEAVWSSSPSVTDDGDAWYVCLGNGYVTDYDCNETFRVRLVRATETLTAQAQAQQQEEKAYRKLIAAEVKAKRHGITARMLEFVVNGNGTVTDAKTGLMWKRVSEEGEFTWDQAIKFNGQDNVVNFGGFSDWRLPDIEELKSLLLPDIPYGSSSYLCKDTFPNSNDTYKHQFWSSSPCDNYAWAVRFGNNKGDVGGSFRHYAFAVRLVRTTEASLVKSQVDAQATRDPRVRSPALDPRVRSPILQNSLRRLTGLRDPAS